MSGMERLRTGSLAGFVVALVAGGSAAAHALYIDDAQNVTFRARFYSQAAIRTNDSQVGTEPTTKTGQLVQHRNFFNPELDAKLTSYTTGLRGTMFEWLAPDELSFRLAAWGFYDGIYDYAAAQFDAARRRPAEDEEGQIQRALILEGDSVASPVPQDVPSLPLIIRGSSLSAILPGAKVMNPRDVYATQRRINELYLNYSKGPLFLRVGKQSISWGEADTVALLDANNPFDVTLGAPGIFEDLDEARIPLWTVRGSVAVPDFGPCSSNTIEAYWVPGDLDTNTGIMPMQALSPYSPRGLDPQANLPTVARNGYQVVVLDHHPKETFENSRWGARVQTVVNRQFTMSAWYYTHFPNAPVPRKVGASEEGVGLGDRQVVISELVHKLTGVAGVSNSFFLAPLDGIARMEAEYFFREPAFIPTANLGPLDLSGDNIYASGHVPYADFLRWELGFDRFFFVRPLNPSTSFTWVSSLVGSWNLSETSQKDFRANGQSKPEFLSRQLGRFGAIPTTDDFVQLKRVEGFVQTTLQTSYLHGRLTPRLTNIVNGRGTYLVQPSADYRIRDWLLLNVAYVHIGGDYQSFGFFRDRDQVATRLTYQIN